MKGSKWEKKLLKNTKLVTISSKEIFSRSSKKKLRTLEEIDDLNYKIKTVQSKAILLTSDKRTTILCKTSPFFVDSTRKISKSTSTKWNYSEGTKSSLKSSRGSNNRNREDCRRKEGAKNWRKRLILNARKKTWSMSAICSEKSIKKSKKTHSNCLRAFEDSEKTWLKIRK